MKIAIIADWLIDFGGAELVIQKIHEIFPDAPIYTSLYEAKNMKPIQNAKIIPSWLQKIPGITKHHRKLLPLMPFIFGNLDLSEYDIIITNTHAFSKRILKTKPNAKIICYCHTPTRYLFDEFGYVEENASWWMKPFLWILIPWLRKLDLKASKIPHEMFANSTESQRRIKKFYNRDVKILFPPVEMDKFIPLSPSEKQNYFLCGGRLVPYKRYDLAIEVCNKLKVNLKIFGDGPDLMRLKGIAGPTIEFLGRVDDNTRKELYKNAKGYLFPQLEDFGITPLEAQASGTPVIAFKKGGALDTVIEGKTGIFFNEQTVESLENALKNYDPTNFEMSDLIENSKRFSSEIFKENVRKIISPYLV